MNNPHYLSKSSQAGFHFTLKENKEISYGVSEVYNAKSGCENGIESLRQNSILSKQFENRDAKDGRFYFVVKAQNGEIIFTSNMCDTRIERRTLRAKVKKHGNTPHILHE